MQSKCENLKFATIGIILSLVLIPFSLKTNIIFTSVVLYLYYMWMLLTGKRGFSLVLISISLTIPSVVDINSAYVTNQLAWIFRNLLLSVISTIVFIIYKKQSLKDFSFIWKPAIIYILLNFLYFIGTSCSFQTSFVNIIYITFLFIICKIDKLDIYALIPLLNLIFILVFLYAVFQFGFSWCPYNWIYNLRNFYDLESLSTTMRAVGIQGNSLVLSAITLFYQSFIYVCLLQGFKINKVLFILSFIVLILTGSRTAFIGLLLLYIVYLVYSGVFNTFSKIMRNVLFLFLICAIIYIFFRDNISYIYDRIQNEGSSHRFAAYICVWNLFIDNVTGVGIDNVEIELINYATYNFIKGFTVDNFYLRQIAAYGILSLPVFYIYYLYFFQAYKSKKRFPIKYKSILFLTITWSLIGFSFNLECYVTLLFVFYGISGHIFRIFSKK